MSDKDFVLSVEPTAFYDPFEGYGPDDRMHFIVAEDAQGRLYSLGHSKVSEQDAWFQIAETFRQKMLYQLEDSHERTAHSDV